MECPSCGGVNPGGSRFCGSCGKQLMQRCAACTAENAPDNRFCSSCGASLAQADREAGSAGAPPSLPPLPSAERRHISVLFCDMVGSTALSTRLDPEELRAVIAQYHDRVTETVTRFGGFVARYMGDGILAYFGWPSADESDTERAVRSGLAAIEAAGSLVFDEEPLQVRVAIATGLVIVGDIIGTGPSQEHAVVGETPNLASRLQALAEPGTLVISEATHNQIIGLFDCQDLGALLVKGFDRPVRVWRVLREKAVHSRSEVLHGSVLSPLIGRDDELNVLLRRWRQARHREGRVVLLSGEPGIGKSRLIAALTEQLADQDYASVRCFCSPHHRDSALHPMISQLAREAGFGGDDSPGAKFHKLAALLGPMRPSEEELAVFVELMSLTGTRSAPPLGDSPQRKKEKMFEALWRRLECLAAARPVLMILEDAHWADPTTRELLDFFMERLRTRPILLTLTFRPEFSAPWTGQAGVTVVALSRLGERDAAVLAARVQGASTLRRDVLDRIVTQSDGVPLFIEELTMSVVESSVPTGGRASSPTVPSTLRGSLTARLDRLGDAKQVAQIGAVIGREFSYSLLAAVAPIGEQGLREALAQLVASGLLFGRGRPPLAFYRFKHALVQDTAYESLLRSSRGPIHAKIADALKRLAPDVELTGPELLGHHYAQAGLIEQAAEYYRRAGEQSIERSAIAEAKAHLERGLGLARSMPEAPTRYALEARLSLALGSVSIITEGYGGAELAARMDNSVALARRADQRPLLIRALFGEWAFKVHIGDLTKAIDVAREMVALSEREDDATVRIVAATSLGINYAYFGRFLEARELFEKCLAEPDIARTGGLGSPHPQDQEVLARTYLSRTLSCLGEIERGSEEGWRSIERARKLGHHPSLAMALTMACRQAWLIRDEGVVRQRAAELIALADEQGFPYWLARGRCYAGWVAVAQGQVEEGLTLLKQALSHLETTDVAMGNIAGLVGDAYLRAGLFQPALRYIDEALRVAAKTGESWMDAELHRLKGVILRARPGHPASVAEAHFLRALDIARSQAARLWELRTAADLARLWLQEHKLMEASRLLDEVRSVSPIGGSAADLAEIESLAKDLAKLSGASVGGSPILHEPEGPNVS